MTKVVGIGLLGSAFAPLVVLIALVRVSEFGIWTWIIVGVSCAATILLGLVLRSVRGLQQRGLESKSVRRADERVLAFTSSYIVPVVVALSSGKGAVSIAATFALVVLLMVIYVRAGLYHLNPTLAVLGFRLYEVTAENDIITMVLSRARYIPQKGVLSCQFVGEDVAIQFDDSNGRQVGRIDS